MTTRMVIAGSRPESGRGRQWPPWGDASKFTRILGAAAAATSTARWPGGRSGSTWPSTRSSLIRRGTSAAHSGRCSRSQAAARSRASIPALYRPDWEKRAASVGRRVSPVWGKGSVADQVEHGRPAAAARGADEVVGAGQHGRGGGGDRAGHGG